MKDERLLVVTLLIGTFACAACGPRGKPPFAVGSSPDPEPSTTCPFGIRGARLEMRDTDEGVVIDVRAFGDVNEVRRRAADAAAMYGPGAHRGLGHEGKHGGGERHGLGLSRLGVAVRAKSEVSAEGARIVVRPKDARDLDRMRHELWAREGRVRRGECP